MSKSILCATDLSDQSAPALAVAAALTDRLEADPLWLLHAVDFECGAATNERPDSMATLLEAEVAKASALTSGSVHSMALYGDAPAALREFAERHRALLLVVASKGHGDTPLRRIGGMSEALAELSTTPLLVVRDAAPFEAWGRGERSLRILCGASHGTAWLAGLEWAKKLRRAGTCDITVAQVYYAGEERHRYGLSAGHSLVGADIEVEALLRRDLESRVAGLEGNGSSTIRLMAGVGRIGDHLLTLAAEEGADLVVVGDNHHRGLARLSSVAAVTLHYAKASVLLVPGELAEAVPLRPIQRVLVASDMQPASERALAQAYAMLPSSGQVTLLHVVREPEADLGAVQRALEATIPAFRERQTRIEIVQGVDIPAAICAAAERADADVLCLASSRRLTRALGSIPDKVMRHTTRPVLLVNGAMPA